MTNSDASEAGVSENLRDVIRAHPRTPRVSILVLVVLHIFLSFLIFAVISHISQETGYVVGVVALLGGGLFLLVVRICLNRKVIAIEVSEEGIWAQTRGGKEMNLNWTQITEVVGRAQSVSVFGLGRHITIESHFEHFVDIVRAIQEACRQRSIENRNFDQIDGNIDFEPGTVHDSKRRPPRYKTLTILVTISILAPCFLILWLAGAPLWGAAIFIAVPLIVVSVIVLRAIASKKYLRTIQIDEVGFQGVSFEGKEVDIRWDEIFKVAIADMRPDGSGYILVNARGKELFIDDDFPQLAKMISLVTKACEEKDIWFWRYS